MELLTLNLNKPLAWRHPVQGLEGTGPRFASVLSAIETAPEGSEVALFFDWDAAVDPSGDDGPKARRPLTRPFLSGASEPASEAVGQAGGGGAHEERCGGITEARPGASGERGGGLTEARLGAPEERGGWTRRAALDPGRYLFVQARPTPGLDGEAAEAWLADFIEWFAREAWWIGATAAGPLALRLVREDGKIAAQLLRAIP